MALPGVGALADLATLDRRFLHLFVAGPGEGEGLAIALPGAGWVLVDGCRSVYEKQPDGLPLEQILATFSNEAEAVELMVLTHPHRDHFHGFAEMLEARPPKAVAIVGIDGPERTLVEEVDVLAAALKKPSSTAAALRESAVLGVLRAVDAFVDAGGRLIPIHGGRNLLARSDVSIDARAPDEKFLRRWFEAGEMAEMIRHRANWLSAVLEIDFGQAKLVLGADMPVRDSGVHVPTGWELIIRTHPSVTYHLALKIPHHGSRDALHDDLVGPYEVPRAWCLTPFNSSSLPRTDDDDGLDILLRGQSPIMLTAMSLSKKLQAAHDEGRTTPALLHAGTRELRKGGTFRAGDTLWRSGSAIEPLDAVWCVAFDSNGSVAGRWRGRAAFEVASETPA